MRVLAGLLAWLALAAPAAADERILEFGSEIRVLADGHLEVTETIRVRAEGTDIRRGIYRDFPTRYSDRFGNQVVVDFELLGVSRDGVSEPHFTEALANGVRINTGNDDFLPTLPAEYTWRLRYRTNRQLGFFADHDELYWNVTGLGWQLPIGRAWARIELPKSVPPAQLSVDCYAGVYGTTRQFCEATAVDGGGEYATRVGLLPQEGLTVVLGFPKGLVTPPTRAQTVQWFLRDNAGVLVAWLGLAALVGFYVWRWLRVGRDPPAGPVFPHYDPPPGLSAGEARVLSKMGYDNRAFAADVVQMAVHGTLDIHVDGDDWRLVRRPDADAGALSSPQRAIAATLFAGDDEVELKDTEATRVGGARSAHAKAIGRRLVPSMYVTNGNSLFAGIVFSLVAGFLAFVVGGRHGIPLVLLACGGMLVAHGLFAAWLKAPTRGGRKAMDAIAGLRLYLTVAERDELAAAPVPGARGGEPPLDAARYEALLPYALALEVDAAWSRRFSDAVGVQEAARSQPAWYHGSQTMPMGLASLGPTLGSALTSQISSSATPPGSSSGSSGGGGGGFSGGGGGGGGGGGR